ncbi:NADPH:quinone reductase-like Zn-dependent oxidoreductase [Geomicrobium halophilum]|uniref:NADPH:quinone reductase-like Zn-dependent oxidoreductase n=1 Tax=Geomicrobium halophilum TaxID=549000 RepID=A0A841Q2L9_9BACL|nr:NADP-dependent oxidoreductase [Geomicrobium halophilum]MBB6450808.1 NADPH:quinone reductase-like Zn-dependent oxidoreductase [Geomicrobium halophilum]
MKGIGIHKYGDETQLTIIEAKPMNLASDQVRVSIRASGVNPIDWKLREGYLKDVTPFDPPLTLGWDGAGKITEVGEDVKDLQVGDDVFFRPELTEHGTYAEEIVTEADLVQRLPEGLSYVEGSSLPLVGLTVIQGLSEIGKLQSDQHVLILGGSGGVGTIAIQIAKAIGANVTTTCSAKNADFVTELGADHVIAYDQASIQKGGPSFDLLFDAVGPEAYQEAITRVNLGGTAVSIAGGASANDEISAVEKEQNIYAENMFMTPDKEKMAKLKTYVDQGQVKPIISHTSPMTIEGARQAHIDSQSNRTQGKIVLTREADGKIE